MHTQAALSSGPRAVPVVRRQKLTVLRDAKLGERQLVLRAQAGDRRAFDLLVLKYRRRLFNLILRIVHSESDAEDVTQVSFLRAYLGIKSFRGECAFYTWLYRVAINCCKSAKSQRAREPMVLSLDGLEDEQSSELVEHLHDPSSPEDLAIKDEVRKTLVRALGQLPRDYSLALELREIDDMSYDEISIAMGTPVGTVRSRISRARDLIDRELQSVSQQGLGRCGGFTESLGAKLR